jgi:hypothetical protein
MFGIDTLLNIAGCLAYVASNTVAAISGNKLSCLMVTDFNASDGIADFCRNPHFLADLGAYCR